MASDGKAVGQLWLKRQAEFKEIIDEMLQKESAICASLKTLPPQHVAIKNLELADLSLNLISCYVVLFEICTRLTKVKSDTYLAEARKYIFKSLIYMEEVVSNFIDVPYSDIDAKLKLVANFPDFQRLKLINKLGFTIDRVISACGENSKWKWSYVEWQGRYAAIVKNFVDIRKYIAEFDPRSVGYRERFEMMEIAKKYLILAAEGYRQKYELTSHRIDDIKLALQFLGCLKRLYGYLRENEEAEEIKKKIEVWKAKMEEDAKHADEAEKRKNSAKPASANDAFAIFKKKLF